MSQVYFALRRRGIPKWVITLVLTVLLTAAASPFIAINIPAACAIAPVVIVVAALALFGVAVYNLLPNEKG